jgi:hypothetical protein
MNIKANEECKDAKNVIGKYVYGVHTFALVL